MARPKCSNKVKLTSFLVTIFGLFATVKSTAQVPLLLWSNDRLPPFASTAAGHITSQDQLDAYLTKAFASAPQTVVLFLQDKPFEMSLKKLLSIESFVDALQFNVNSSQHGVTLSLDDFTVFGGTFGNQQDNAFKNIQTALQSSPSSVVIPALEWSGSTATLTLLQDKLGVSPLLVDADSLSQLTIDTSVNQLLLISLPYCSGLYKSCKEDLLNNDEVVGKVLSVMAAKNSPYTAVYTGLQPSRMISEPSVSEESVGRSLLQAVVDVSPPIVFPQSGSPCIMLWAQNLSVSLSSSQWTDLTSLTPSLSGSTCNATNSRLVLTYTSGIVLSFAMSQRFYPVSARNWFTLDSVQLQSNGQSASFIGRRGIYAPAEYSFHCQTVTSFQDALLVPDESSMTQNTSQWRVSFTDFQIQGFNLLNGTNFSYASDCAGFFTAGIWMGLLTSLLMLLIFVYGLHMIMQLNTMDRFDDPKGPSISVPQSE